MCETVCTNRQDILNQLRKLWEQHVYWTRFFIISTLADLNDIDEVTTRLLQNPKDFAKLLEYFYGVQIANQFQNLFTEHLMIGGDLVNALKKNEDTVSAIRKKWYANADSIAKFLSDINPYWEKNAWTDMLYDHIKMTEEEAYLYLHGNYTDSIEIFDKIENEALKMADYMFEGIMKQCRCN